MPVEVIDVHGVGRVFAEVTEMLGGDHEVVRRTLGVVRLADGREVTGDAKDAVRDEMKRLGLVF